MPRRKSAPFPPWKTAARDGREKAFVQIGLSQLDHPTVLGLNHAALRLYVYMLLEAGAKSTFTFPRSKYERFMSRRGFELARDELTAKGFIGIAEDWHHARKPTVYVLLDEWKRIKNIP